MNQMELLEKSVALRQEGTPFALATVVARRAPVSAHLGDRAIIFADGRMEGFVGGACSREIIRKQALEAMEFRCSRLVSIRPDASEIADSTSEHVIVPMTCASEGAIDVYVEPFVHPREVIVVGATPVAESLTHLSRTMGYDVIRVVESHELHDFNQHATQIGAKLIALDTLEEFLQNNANRPDRAAVVASQGHYDEQALEIILRAYVPYVGLVASRKRGSEIRMALEQNAVLRTDQIHIPAGIDLGARTPHEVALSILAEIIKLQPDGASKKPAPATAPASLPVLSIPATAIDPICSMHVDIATARHKAVVDDVTYYFCCAGCRTKFLQAPERFQATAP